MKTPRNIVIFDGTLQTTAFINRLIVGLSKQNQVHVLGFNETLAHRLPGVNYVPLGSSTRLPRLLLVSLGFAFKALFKKGAVSTFFTYCKLLCTLQKHALVRRNLETATRLIQPDVFHVQWLSLLPMCEPIIAMPDVHVVVSQRGYQNNVRPFVDAKNKAYLASVYPKIDGFHSVSEAMTQVSNKIYSAPDKLDMVVYSGFNFNKLPYRKEYAQSEVPHFVAIGRPHWKKGFQYALQSMKLLKESGVSFRFTIIGGDRGEELKYLVAAYNLEAYVTISAKISQEAVYTMIQDSDIFLLPSLEEGIPNVMIEAMALGTPVIATDCGGVSELLDETTGILIPTRNPEAMTTAIHEVLQMPLEKINAMRMKARERVEEQHNELQMITGMTQLYQHVIERANQI